MSRVLITGGAGFVGSNLSNSFLRADDHVIVFDSLARRGSERNLEWLSRHSSDGQFQFIHGDVRDFHAVQVAARHADIICHLAGQVAVTTSVDNPRTDFEVNALGTLNVLEAARLSGRRPALVFTSTNKVYGGIEDVEVVETATRYQFRDLLNGIPESQPLDFHSPYGCSKGAADQYVRDYARIYNLPTVVFRMSCIYGPRQFGNEDQGWVAHFMIALQNKQPITIYGNGKQVRDILFIDDLLRAFHLAINQITTTAGHVFNIGGGPSNTLAVWSEFGDRLSQMNGTRVTVDFDKWRPGDQPCYVSDIRKAERLLGWRPEIDNETGIRRLWTWIREGGEVFRKPAAMATGSWPASA